MTHEPGTDWPAIVEREGAALADSAAVDPAARVLAAPDWDTTDLIRHVATAAKAASRAV